MGGQSKTIAELIAERDQAIAERDEAIAERDYVIDFLIDLGDALGKSRRLRFQPTADGVEVRSLYASLAEALPPNVLLRHLRGMLSFAPRRGEAALARYRDLVAASELRA